MIKAIPLLNDSDPKSVCGARPYNAVAQAIRNIRSETLSIGLGPDGGLRIEADQQTGGGGEGLDFSSLPFGAYVSDGQTHVNGGTVNIGIVSLDADDYTVTLQSADIVYLHVYLLSGSLNAAVGTSQDLPSGAETVVSFPLCTATSSSVLYRMWLGGYICIGGVWT